MKRAISTQARVPIDGGAQVGGIMVDVVVKVIQVWVAEKVDTTEGERESEDEVWVVMVMVARGVVEAVDSVG